MYRKQVGQLSQTKHAAAWAISGKNISVNSVHLTSLYGAKDILKC